MTDNLVHLIVEKFGGGSAKEIVVFIISMIPILELRGSILAGYIMKMSFLPTYIISVIGNIVPIPFILLFIEKIFELLKRTKLKGFVERLERKALSKSEQITKYGKYGLFLFVAIPLPGTGAWTGALIASLLKFKKRQAILWIFLGIVTAGAIMSLISFGILESVF